MAQPSDIAIAVNEVLTANVIGDLRRQLTRRQRLNCCNMFLTYTVYMVQSACIIVTSYGTGASNKTIAWIGVGLGVLASLLHTFEKINNAVLLTSMQDIQRIRDGKYLDEAALAYEESAPPAPPRTASATDSAYRPLPPP